MSQDEVVSPSLFYTLLECLHMYLHRKHLLQNLFRLYHLETPLLNFYTFQRPWVDLCSKIDEWTFNQRQKVSIFVKSCFRWTYIITCMHFVSNSFDNSTYVRVCNCDKKVEGLVAMINKQ